jgi:hypothetical protein
MPRYFLPYEKFIVDWPYYVDAAAEKIGVKWPDRSDRSELKIDQFLTLDLRHQRTAFDDIKDHPEVPPLVRQTYNILTNIMANGENKELLDQLDLVRTKFDEDCHTFGAAAEEDLREAYARVVADGGEKVAWAKSLDKELKDLPDAYARAVTDSEEKVAWAKSLVKELKDLRAAHSKLISEQDNLMAERDALSGAYNRVIAERDAMLASRSWRLTGPLRSLRGLFAR